MATGTLEHSAPNEIQSSSLTSGCSNMRPNDIYGKEKKLVNSIRSSPLRSTNPFLITERSDEKQLCAPSKTLHVDDFVLVKTVGTGQRPLYSIYNYSNTHDLIFLFPGFQVLSRGYR